MADEKKSLNLIEGKVAAVLNERELAINIGTEHGVTVGMKFKVLAEMPTEIIDPVSGEILGSLDRSKVNVKATDVKERFSICRTYKIKQVSDPISRYLASALIKGSREEIETLKATDASFPPPLSEDESYVKKGDRVLQIINDFE